MRQLRFVRLGADADRAVCETVDGTEQFELLIDAEARDALRPQLPVQPRTEAVEDAPRISPREIQTRVRAGVAPEELAAEHGLSLERVMRFAGAVLEERARVADEARRARARRPEGPDGQIVPFGETVDLRFEAHGIDPAAVKWGAYRREDGQWVVAAQWMGGDSERQAEWSFHLGTRTVTPLDGAAGDLLSDKPVRMVSPRPPAAEHTPPLAPGVVVFPAMPDAHTNRLPRMDQVFDQDAHDPDTRRAAAAAQRAAAEEEPSHLPGFEAPPLPLHVAGAPKNTANAGTAKRRDESDEQKAERARIPSWDDILLGVRRKND